VGAIHVRDLPLEVIEALKRRAARNHRSLQQELKRLLCSVADEELPKPRLPPLELKMSAAPPGPAWVREDLYGDDGR
jgi:plasmid stability protein